MKKIFVSVALFASAIFAADIAVSDLVVKQTPPKAPNTAFFMTITNNSDKDIALVGAKSDLSDRIELHTVVYEGEKMTMVKVPKITIKAKSSVQLMSGAEHIMALGIKKPVKKDTKVSLTLEFDNGKSLNFKDVESIEMTGMGIGRAQMQGQMRGQGQGRGQGRGAGMGQGRGMGPCQNATQAPCLQ